MEHNRSNAPSPADVPSPLPPPSGMQPTLARLITDMTQGNSSGDVLLPPVPSFPTQSPASFVDVISSYTHNSPTAGRPPSDSMTQVVSAKLLVPASIDFVRRLCMSLPV